MVVVTKEIKKATGIACSGLKVKAGYPVATSTEVKPGTGTEKLQTGLKFVIYFQDDQMCNVNS